MSDHHAADRDRPVRTLHEIHEHINADHPCCIGVGDAVAVLKENERLLGLLEAQEKSRVSVEEWSQEKSRVIDRLTNQRDEALAAMNADTADVVLAKCVAEAEVHRLEEENARLKARLSDLEGEREDWVVEDGKFCALEEENKRLKAEVLYEQERNANNVHAYQDRLDAALSLAEALQITHPYIAVRLRHALKGEK